MANTIKTAISLDKKLFDEIESLAQEMSVSRSQVFSIAARQFIERCKGKEILEQINTAHQDHSSQSEEELLKRMRTKQSDMVKGQW